MVVWRIATSVIRGTADCEEEEEVMKVIILSAFVSFVVSLIMMKWHITNATQLFEKHLRDSDVWFREQLVEVLNIIVRHKNQ